MTKTLLVLAASMYQIPAIETAKRLGYRVITTDNVPDNPGHALADASFGVDTTDPDGVLALAVRENISGVIAPGTDVAVMTAAHLAERLGLAGPSPAVARVLTHKQLFREFLAGAALPCPRVFPLTDDKMSARGLFDKCSWLVKPNRSSGSKGIFIVRSEAELQSRLPESRVFSTDRTAMLEEFVHGTQHTCDGVLQDGKVALALLTDRDTALPPYTVTTGHRVPSRLPEPIQAKALSVIEDVLGRLRVSSGPFDCDFIVDGERIVLIEITPRLGGNSLSRLFQAALDFDFVAYAVSHACGDAFPLPERRRPKPAAIAILGVDRPGNLSWNLPEAETLKRESWVQTLLIDLPEGAKTERFINGRHRVGEALITGRDRDEVDARLIEFKRRLALAAI